MNGPTSISLLRHARPDRRYGQSGFTLIELVVAVMVAAILAGIAAPNFVSFIAGQRIRMAAYDLTYALTHARSEAIKRNGGVTLTPATGGWKNGWTLTAGATVLNRHEALRGLDVAGPAATLTYNSSGRLNAAATPFSVSDTDGNAPARCVSVDLSGLPNSRSGSC